MYDGWNLYMFNIKFSPMYENVNQDDDEINVLKETCMYEFI